MKGSRVSVGLQQGLHNNHFSPIPMAKHTMDFALPPPVDAVLRIAPFPQRLVMEVYLGLQQQQQQQQQEREQEFQLHRHHDGLSNDVTRTLENDSANLAIGCDQAISMAQSNADVMGTESDARVKSRGDNRASRDGADVIGTTGSDARRVESRADDGAAIDVITAPRLLLAVEEEAAARKRGERDEVTTEISENFNGPLVSQSPFQSLPLIGESLPHSFMEEDAGEFDSDTSNNGNSRTSGGDHRNASEHRLPSSLAAADGNHVDMECSEGNENQQNSRQSNDSENLSPNQNFQNIPLNLEDIPPVQPHPARAQAAAAGFEASSPTALLGDQPHASRHGDADEVTVSDEEARERRRHQEKLRALRSENRRLRNRNTCRQCRQRPVSLTLLPCGHFLFCRECGSTFTACPVCHKTILADVHTFMG